MTYIKYFLIVFGFIWIAACSQGTGEEKPSVYEKKRAKLDSLKGEQSKLNKKIQSLEQEVLKLRPDNLIKRIPVHISQPNKGTFHHYIKIQGKVENKNSVMINPKMGGRVAKVYVKKGQKVRKGQTLARVNNSVMYKQLQELKTSLELAEKMYKKQKRLFEQNVGTEVDYLNAKNRKESLERRINTLKAQINQSAITSTINGVIDEKYIKEGESTAPGAPAFRVINNDDIVVSVPVPDQFLGDLQKGKTVDVFFPDVKDTVTGKITFISDRINPVDRTFLIEIEIPKNKKPETIRANMLAVVKINDKTFEHAIFIDKNLVQEDEETTKVFVMREVDGMKRAFAQPVELGIDYGGEVIVNKGLKAEDQIITHGYQDLVDRAPLKVIKK